MPAPITILEERSVGPDLGADSIHAGAVASIVGVVLVVIFMLLFYGLFGIFADIALFFNLCLMLASLSLLGATLTLPGIAGIALTGMAVDANVLIYGASARNAQRSDNAVVAGGGFTPRLRQSSAATSRRWSPILLYWLGPGASEGFAVTLSVGVDVAVLRDPGDPAADRYLAAPTEAEEIPLYTALIVIRRVPKIDFMRGTARSLPCPCCWARFRSLVPDGRLNLGIDFKGGLLMERGFPAGRLGDARADRP